MTVAKTGTVVGTAKELNLTQTGITQRIKSLEKDLGLTLFLRSRKGMSLTQEGKALYQYCIEAEELEGRALGTLGSARQREVSVTIAGPTSLVSGRLVKQCQRLFKQWPNLNINFLIDDTENRSQLLKRGLTDFVLLRPFQVVNEFDSKILKSEEYVLVGSYEWRGRRLDDILKNERIIDFHENDPTTLQYLRKFGLEPLRSRMFANENRTLVELFSMGIGYGTLTRELAEPLIKSKKLCYLNGAKSKLDPIALAWYPRSEMPQYFRSVVEALR